MIEGDLRNVPLTDVLQIVTSGQKSGVLTVEHEDRRVRLHVERGRILAAHAAPGVPIGELLVRMELLTAREVQELLDRQAAADDGVPLGMRAVRERLMDSDDLQTALRRQATEVLADLLAWRHGTFSFAERSNAHTVVPTEGGHDAMELLMEADALRQELDAEHADPGAVFRRAGDPTRVRLPEGAWDLLGLVDGVRPARLVAAESDLGEARGLRVLHRLAELEVLEPVDTPAPDPAALVVCADPAVAPLLRLALHRVGIRAEPAVDADEALAKLDAVRPAVLVVVDRAGEGWALLRAVRSLPGRAHLPALVLESGDAAVGWWRKVRRPKAETMRRPFDEFELQRVVARLSGRPLT